MINAQCSMKKLLSLPPNLVGSFHEVTGLDPQEYFCTCDPVGHRLGSGGGTAWLLQEAWRTENLELKIERFDSWLSHLQFGRTMRQSWNSL